MSDLNTKHIKIKVHTFSKFFVKIHIIFQQKRMWKVRSCRRYANRICDANERTRGAIESDRSLNLLNN